MKNLSFLTAIISILILFSSCKKDDPIEPGPANTGTPTNPVVHNYFPLSVGSYWKYINYEIDTNNVANVLGFDTMRIVADTMIDDKLFYVLAGTYFGSFNKSLVRDSAGCLIDGEGDTFFSPNSPGDTISVYEAAGYYTIYSIMEPGTQQVEVPAGSFTTMELRAHAHFDSPGYPWGNPRYLSSYYSNNVGMIKQTSFYLSLPGVLERRLYSYHIAQ